MVRTRRCLVHFRSAGRNRGRSTVNRKLARVEDARRPIPPRDNRFSSARLREVSLKRGSYRDFDGLPRISRPTKLPSTRFLVLRRETISNAVIDTRPYNSNRHPCIIVRLHSSRCIDIYPAISRYTERIRMVLPVHRNENYTETPIARLRRLRRPIQLQTSESLSARDVV